MSRCGSLELSQRTVVLVQPMEIYFRILVALSLNSARTDPHGPGPFPIPAPAFPKLHARSSTPTVRFVTANYRREKNQL
jgi:hypothetical protein